MLDEIITNFGIDIVHIHHLINHYFDAIDVAKKHGLKIIMSLHDFYSVCPAMPKLFKGRFFCDSDSTEQCAECLKAQYTTKERGKKFIEQYRRVFKANLKKCDLLIAPSFSAKSEMLKTYPDLDIKVIEHGVDLPRSRKIVQKDKKSFDAAFIGGIGIHKGLKIIQELPKKLCSTNITLHLFGITSLPITQNKHFIDHGRYERQDIPALLKQNDIDLICLFSIWPETYAYTLTESVSCGVPVVAFDIGGAIAERVKKFNLGYVIPFTEDIDIIKSEIVKIAEDKATYQEKLKSINEYKIKTVAEMAKEYATLYQKNLLPNRAKVNFDWVKKKIKETNELEHEIANYNQCKNEVEAARTNYNQILNSARWRLVSKIKVPKWLGRLLRGVYHQIKKIIKR